MFDSGRIHSRGGPSLWSSGVICTLGNASCSREKANEQEGSRLHLPGFQQVALEPPPASPAEQNCFLYQQNGGLIESRASGTSSG